MSQNKNKSNEKSLTALQPRNNSQYAGILRSGVYICLHYICVVYICLHYICLQGGPVTSQHRGHLAGQYAALWEFGLAVFNLSVFLPGVARWLSSKESICQLRRHGFDPWSRGLTCRRTVKPMCHLHWACAPEPGDCTCRAHPPKLLKPDHPRARAPQQEKPPHCEIHAQQPESTPCSPQLEKSPHSNEDPARPKIKII